MVDDVVAVGAARPRLQIGRGIDVADAEPGQIGGKRRGVREAEAVVELQAVGRPRDRRRAGVRHRHSSCGRRRRLRHAMGVGVIGAGHGPAHRPRTEAHRRRRRHPPATASGHGRAGKPASAPPTGWRRGRARLPTRPTRQRTTTPPVAYHRRSARRRRSPPAAARSAPAARPARGDTSRASPLCGVCSRSLPVELGRGKGRFGHRVGDALAHRRVLELREAGELVAPALAHGVGQIGPEIAEERERLRRRPFLAHEQHRHLRQQQVDGGDGAHRLGRRGGRQPVAEGAVADLVVVLDEGDEGGRRQVCAGLAARHGRDRASSRPGTRSPRPAPGPACSVSPTIVGIVAGRLARGRDMQHVVDVVVPLRRVPARARRPRPRTSRLASFSSFSSTRWTLPVRRRRAHALRPAPPADASGRRPGSRAPRRAAGRRGGIPRSSRGRCG